jgi:uncharacterized membrane protein (UPF0136 family)
MHLDAKLILWIYIVLLFVGGLIGFLKANSKISLITSSCFAAVLILCNVGLIFQPDMADVLKTGVLVFLMVFFAFRLTKSKKFMPNGLMAVLTLATLVLLHVHLR